MGVHIFHFTPCIPKKQATTFPFPIISNNIHVHTAPFIIIRKSSVAYKLSVLGAIDHRFPSSEQPTVQHLGST